MNIPNFEGLNPEIRVNGAPSHEKLKGLHKSNEASMSPIFVVGSPRSGTTLLGNVLGGNEQLVAGDESMFLLDHWNMFNNLLLGGNRRGADFLASFTSSQKYLDYTSRYVHEIYTDLVDSKESATRAVDHTPLYSHIFHYIELLFDQPVYLHIVRDQEAVVDSLRRIRETGGVWGQETDEKRREFHDYWVAKARDISNFVTGRYFEIEYEDFIESPEDTLDEFLVAQNLTWSDDMADRMTMLYAQTN